MAAINTKFVLDKIETSFAYSWVQYINDYKAGKLNQLNCIFEGADYIECDLAVTKDGALVCLHDAFLSSVTDIADHPEFADRRVCYADVYQCKS